jgi:acyl-CoA reductase-like NAD-dependent aldehyde dehydrogenase
VVLGIDAGRKVVSISAPIIPLDTKEATDARVLEILSPLEGFVPEKGLQHLTPDRASRLMPEQLAWNAQTFPHRLFLDQPVEGGRIQFTNAEAYAEAFRAVGLPEGVFQYLHLDHGQVARVIEDSRIGFVAFTGSVAGGHAVQRAAATRFVGTGLELGGKDPAYVRADAALEPTVENLVDGAMFNSGQSCCAIERIYVHQDLYDRFVEAFVELTRQYRLGDPTDPATTLGPLVRTEAADKVRAQVREAIAKGARPLLDLALFPAAREGTPYLAPQVLVGVDHSMSLMTEETFGPVVGVMPVRNDEEAIHLMNDSRYGLTASVWTADPEAALAIGDRVETGTWYMNRCDYLDPALAWTGLKDSGRGCTLSRFGFQPFTRLKSYHLRTQW